MSGARQATRPWPDSTRSRKKHGHHAPKVSDMMRGDFTNLSERKLMDCLTRLGYDIKISVRPAKAEIGHLMLAAAYASLQVAALSNELPRGVHHIGQPDAFPNSHQGAHCANPLRRAGQADEGDGRSEQPLRQGDGARGQHPSG